MQKKTEQKKLAVSIKFVLLLSSFWAIKSLTLHTQRT